MNNSFHFLSKIRIKTIYLSIIMHPVWVLYLARYTFWLTSTWGGGGGGGGEGRVGKMTH